MCAMNTVEPKWRQVTAPEGQRKWMPTKAAIAWYWLISEDGRSRIPFDCDPLEPCCFACGLWDEALCRDNASLADFSYMWDSAKFLERAHMTPRGCAGVNDAANIILLCVSCHRVSPDVRDPKVITDWVLASKKDERSRQMRAVCDTYERVREAGISFMDLVPAALSPDWERELSQIEEYYERIVVIGGVTPEEMVQLAAVPDWRERLTYLVKSGETGTHGSRLSPGTMAWAMRTALAMSSDWDAKARNVS